MAALTENRSDKEILSEKLLTQGAASMSDKELLQLLLSFSAKPEAAKELTERLFNEYGDLSNIFETSGDSLRNFSGLSDSSILLLQSVPSLCKRRMTFGRGEGIVIRSPKDAEHFLAPFFLGSSREQAYLLILNETNELIKYILLGQGTGNEVSMDLRMILGETLVAEGHKVILAHSHPGGYSDPSEVDLRITRQISEELAKYGITLEDHLVFSRQDCHYMSRHKNARSLNLGFT